MWPLWWFKNWSASENISGLPPDNAPPIADLMHCASENSNKTLTNVFAGFDGDLSNSKGGNEGNKKNTNQFQET